MSSCHFGAMCFLWVSLVVPQHSLAALSLVFPAGFQQGSLFTLPTAAQPGDAQGCHHPRALIHELLPWVRQLRAHLSTQEEFLFSSEICHLQKEILKLRVMSSLKKAGKWDWEEHVCSSLNLSAQRMQRGLGWVLKYYFEILPSDPDNSSPCWLQVSAVPPALEPAAGTGACWWTCHAFLWKKCWKPQSLGLQCCREHSLPAWQVCTRKQKGFGTKFDFCLELHIFPTNCQHPAQWV